MKVIVISGERSGVGKTYMAEQLLKGLKGWSALKVTVDKGGGCPHRNRSCGVCGEIEGEFQILKDEKTINTPGKDTARLKQSGAKEVIWLRAKPEGLNEGLHRALFELSDCRGVIIEGNSALQYIRPDLNVHVHERC